MRKFVFAIVAVLLFSVSLRAQVSQSEYKALKAIYEKMGGKNWKNARGWDFSQSADDVKGFNKVDSTGWFGLYVKKGKVEKLNLSNNQLTGEIPEELYDLEYLTSLVLSKNSITGAISPKIGKLDMLTVLDLSVNQLSGNIPDEICKIGVNAVTREAVDEKKGTELRLFLSRNKLTGPLPAKFASMPLWSKPNAGVKIELYGNQLTGTVPVELEKIKNLLVLRLEKNKFEGNVPQIRQEKE